MFSRGLNLCRTLQKVNKIKTNNEIVRQGSSYAYRSLNKVVPKKVTFWAEFGSAFMWWWIFWHLFTEYEHITGEFPFPDAKQWTDAELGIPDSLE